VNGLKRLVALVEAVVDICGRLAAWSCVALVLLVAGNVFARYFFRTGAIWLQELEWHLISPIALIGMSYALLRGAQVRVDVLFASLAERTQMMIEIATGLLLAVFALIMIDLSLPFVQQAYRIGEGSPNPGGVPYRFVLKAFIPFGFGLLALQGAAHVIRHFLAIYERR
jgi:TRAP-type mannitol/chloroaromatic compound transport system permease small subunit